MQHNARWTLVLCNENSCPFLKNLQKHRWVDFLFLNFALVSTAGITPGPERIAGVADSWADSSVERDKFLVELSYTHGTRLGFCRFVYCSARWRYTRGYHGNAWKRRKVEEGSTSIPEKKWLAIFGYIKDAIYNIVRLHHWPLPH